MRGAVACVTISVTVRNPGQFSGSTVESAQQGPNGRQTGASLPYMVLGRAADQAPPPDATESDSRPRRPITVIVLRRLPGLFQGCLRAVLGPYGRVEKRQADPGGGGRRRPDSI